MRAEWSFVVRFTGGDRFIDDWSDDAEAFEPLADGH